MARNVVQEDYDEDGILETMLAYVIAPPAVSVSYDPRARATGGVTITFGVRSSNRDWGRREHPVVKFQSVIALRYLY